MYTFVSMKKAMLCFLLGTLAGCGTPAAPSSVPAEIVAPPSVTAMSPATATPSPLPPTATVVQTSATPVGGVIHTQVAGDPPRHGALWRANLAGRDHQQILTVADDRSIASIAVSPNGQLIAYQDAQIGTWQSQLHLVTTDGTDNRVLLDDADDVSVFLFSPDSAHLAIYRSFATDQVMVYESDIWVMPTAGGAPRQIVARACAVGAPAWLDAAHIGYTRAAPPDELGDIVQVAIDTDADPVAIAHGRLLSVAPDSQTLLVSLELIGHNIATDQGFRFGIITQDTAPPSILRQWQLPVGTFAWSPDGTQLAQRGINGSTQLLHIERAGVEELPTLGARHDLFGALAWDSAGTGLLYTVTTSGPAAATELRLLDLHDRTERVLLSLPGSMPPIIAICAACGP